MVVLDIGLVRDWTLILTERLLILARQCRAARGLLDWSQQDLADRAGLGIVTIRQIEADITEPQRATPTVLRQAFERAGIEFIEENGGGPGVRIRKRQRARKSK